jgi:geranylgeranyl pyrophosphate synthase
MSDFLTQAQPLIQQLNDALANQLPSVNAGQKLLEASHYSLMNGGKRVRPLLVYGAFQALSVKDHTNKDQWLLPACAVEMVHSYSLVHDDLPAMDNDDLRRGKPTCHIKYDDATAILVGDGLQTRAFEILANSDQFNSDIKIKMIQSLSAASGLQGMVLGQAIDLYSENKTLALTQLEHLHSCKTGALIRASVCLGALACETTTLEQLTALDTFADKIGLAFQVVDDILDLTSDTEVLGKPQGSDLAAHKATYPALLGLDGAREKANLLYQEAIAALDMFSEQAEFLRQLAAFIVHRKF